MQEAKKECVLKNETYHCPEVPKGNKKVHFVGKFDPQYRYILASSMGQEIRLLNNRPTIAVTPNGGMRIDATAGSLTKSWPLHIKNMSPGGGGAGGAAGGMGILGLVLAIMLLLNIFSLIGVLGLSNAFGVGAPFGAAEVATSLLFLLQYFSFADVLRGGSTALSNLTANLHWITWFLPLPWVGGGTEVTDIKNATGCIFWSNMGLAAILLLHGLIASKFGCFDRNRTFPHRLAFGHWESRVTHFLIFPETVACVYVVYDATSSTAWIAVAWATLVLYTAYAIAMIIVVQRAVAEGDVVWVWHATEQEAGEILDETGYWSDASCDQLTTEPANRSLFRWIFPWKWVSTVADIDPVVLSTGDATGALLTYKNSFNSPGEAPNYPMGKTPQTVEVNQARSPGMCCPQQRLVAGLMRTSWLDILFTYQALTRFHASASDALGGEAVVPLTVKTCQLTGPLTGGRLCFFFDGVRLPFVRIAELVLRLLIGVCIGIALASKNHVADAVAFGFIGGLGLAALIYVAVTCPFARTIENWLLGASMFVVSLSAFGLMGHAIADSKPSTVVDVLLWITIVVCSFLALYSLVITFSVFAAVTCPPLDETKLLSKMCNAELSIADHQAGWSVDTPAYSKYHLKDFKAELSASHGRYNVGVYPSPDVPTLEVGVEELVRACRTGSLKTPAMCAYVTSEKSRLGYRHINIYDPRGASGQLAQFLKEDPALAESASTIASNIASQVQQSSGTLPIVTITHADGGRRSGRSGRSGSYDPNAAAGATAGSGGREFDREPNTAPTGSIRQNSTAVEMGQRESRQ
eukprot:GHVU01093293.1.p1 GENE.GHVU01093293.1~~GHVU01093293.1.p1  ORF type:complete len:850 (+),score=166.08 GHVU01093293.1:130-2550(+)